jgi:hypothetical protein
MALFANGETSQDSSRLSGGDFMDGAADKWRYYLGLHKLSEQGLIWPLYSIR